MLRLSCNQCGAAGYYHLLAGPLTDPHSLVSCSCCPQDHDHSGVGCRPITIELLPGAADLHKAGV